VYINGNVHLQNNTMIEHLSGHAVSSLLTHVALLKLAVANHLSLNLREVLIIGVLLIQSELSFADLARRLSIPKSSLTGLVDNLFRKGLVERRQDQTNRRRWFVFLTRSGQQLAQDLHLRESEALETAFGGLTSHAREELRLALHALEQQLR